MCLHRGRTVTTCFLRWASMPLGWWLTARSRTRCLASRRHGVTVECRVLFPPAAGSGMEIEKTMPLYLSLSPAPLPTASPLDRRSVPTVFAAHDGVAPTSSSATAIQPRFPPRPHPPPSAPSLFTFLRVPSAAGPSSSCTPEGLSRSRIRVRPAGRGAW